jgi:hypothetical protein
MEEHVLPVKIATVGPADADACDAKLLISELNELKVEKAIFYFI